MRSSAKYRCRGKQKLTWEQAQWTAEHANHFGEGLEAYLCPHCGGSHVGHPAGSARLPVIEDKANERARHDAAMHKAKRLAGYR